jgi:putative peptidoglycan lipid II flippase
VGQEVVQTSDGGLTPDPTGAEPGEELLAQDTGETLVRNTAVMSAGTGLSRVTGLLRAITVVAVFGRTALGNIYATANTAPNIVYELVLGGVLTSVFVPVFVEWLQAHGRDESWAVARRVMTLALVSLTVVAALGAIFATQIMRLYLLGNHDPNRQAQIELGAFFLRWFMPQIVFYGVGAVATGLLNAHRRFAAPMFAPILNNLVVIASFLTFAWMAEGDMTTIASITAPQRLVLAIGTTLGVVAMTVALWPSLRALGFRWHWAWDLRHPAVRRLGKLAVWVIVYVVANQVAYMIVLILTNSSEAGHGGTLVYQSAFLVFQLPYAIFAVSIFTALLPGMAGRWTGGDAAGVRTLLSQGLRSTAVIVLPAVAGYLALAIPISMFAFRHESCDTACAVSIARTLQAFTIGLLFFSVFQLLSRAFYAMQDTRTPALVNIAAAVVNIAADLVFMLVFHWGIPGLALGHAASYMFSTAVCLVILRGRLHGLDGGRIAKTLAKVIPASIATGLVAWGVAHAIGTIVGTTTTGERLVAVTAGVVAGLLVFVASALILRIQEADDVRNALVRRFRG